MTFLLSDHTLPPYSTMTFNKSFIHGKILISWKFPFSAKLGRWRWFDEGWFSCRRPRLFDSLLGVCNHQSCDSSFLCVFHTPETSSEEVKFQQIVKNLTGRSASGSVSRESSHRPPGRMRSVRVKFNRLGTCQWGWDLFFTNELWFLTPHRKRL